MKNKSQNQRIIEDDLLRFKKNKLAQWLTILGLAFNCLYIMLLYSFNQRFFYKFEIGVSVLLTLVLLLTLFLSSEGVKVYNKKYCIVLLVIAVIQIVRVFGLPFGALQESAFKTNLSDASIVDRDYFGVALPQGVAFALLVIYLVLSAASLIAAAVYGYIVAVRHENFAKALADGSVDVDAALKAVEEETAQTTVVAESTVETVDIQPKVTDENVAGDADKEVK